MLALMDQTHEPFVADEAEAVIARTAADRLKAVADGFPTAAIVAVEPAGANDFCQSLTQGKRVRIERPASICDGLLSYDVGEHNWPIPTCSRGTCGKSASIIS